MVAESRQQRMERLPQFLVECEIVLEGPAPVGAKREHLLFEAVVVVPERRDRIARQMQGHAQAAEASGPRMERQDAPVPALELVRQCRDVILKTEEPFGVVRQPFEFGAEIGGNGD